MRHVLLIGVLWTLLWGCGAAEPAAWQMFDSSVGRFHVLMPGTPRLTSTKVSSPAGSVTKNLYLVKLGTLEVSAEYSDIPQLALTFGGSGAIFDHAEQEFLKDTRAHEISRTKISYEKHPGREVSFEIAGADVATGRLRMYLIGKRLYCLAAFGPRSAGLDAARLDGFFASFAATK